MKWFVMMIVAVLLVGLTGCATTDQNAMLLINNRLAEMEKQVKTASAIARGENVVESVRKVNIPVKLEVMDQKLEVPVELTIQVEVNAEVVDQPKVQPKKK